MERDLFIKLEKWKDKKKRKPLIIQGARQVGKTWIMKEFGARYFKNTVYINFDNNEIMKRELILILRVLYLLLKLSMEKVLKQQIH